MHAVVLERADHLEAGAVTDVREALPGVAAECALQDPAVAGAIEQRAPFLELAHPVGRLLGVELRHAPVIEEGAALHGVAEVGLPSVLRVDVRQRRGDPALGHHGVRLAEQRLGHQPHAATHRGGFDRRPQSRATRAHHQDVVLVDLVALHHSNLGSWIRPIEHMRT